MLGTIPFFNLFSFTSYSDSKAIIIIILLLQMRREAQRDEVTCPKSAT